MTKFTKPQITKWKSGTTQIDALVWGGCNVYIRINKNGIAYDSSFKKDTTTFKDFEKYAKNYV